MERETIETNEQDHSIEAFILAFGTYCQINRVAYRTVAADIQRVFVRIALIAPIKMPRNTRTAAGTYKRAALAYTHFLHNLQNQRY